MDKWTFVMFKEFIQGRSQFFHLIISGAAFLLSLIPSEAYLQLGYKAEPASNIHSNIGAVQCLCSPPHF